MSMRLIITLVILFLIDLYVFQGVRFLIQHRTLQFQRIVNIAYWSITAISLGAIIIGQFVDWHSWPKALRTYIFAFIVIFYLSKILISVFLLVDDVIRGFRFVGLSVFSKLTPGIQNEALRVSRLDFLVKTGFVIASIPFFSLLYGMTGGAYNYKLRRLRLGLPKLPDAFNGYKIVQISDLHTGSFLDGQHLEKAVELINAEKPDVIFFTGDLVNDMHTEALPYVDTFRKLKATHGVYSILGNHDYGDYYKWESISAKEENLRKLKEVHSKYGWRLLLNEHVYLEKDNAKMGLIGVENVSGRRNFATYGDLKKAVASMEKQDVNILLSHDPSHWQHEVVNQHPYIDLTLSGHTHGFQFGVEIPGLKWSPVQYVYKEWADLYNEKEQYLYVNRGLGFIGYPGRVGIMPEITVFTLAKENHAV